MLGRVKRARGLRGEVVVALLGSKPERFVPGLRLWAATPDDAAAPRELTVASSWLHSGQLVLQFDGIADRTAAEQIEGAELRIPLEQRPPAPEGEYYLSDLVGCRVETTGGRDLGEVARYLDYGAAPLLEVRQDGREILVPWTSAIYREVDPARRRIVVELPEGLEEL